MIMKKIWESVFDEEVHNAFLKFGRGEYKNKYLLEGKRQAKKWAIKAGAEYANFLVGECLKGVSGSVAVKGVIISTFDMRDEIEFDIAKVGNFQGIRKHSIDTEIEASQILNLIDKYPKVLFALSFKGDNFVLKIKAGKPKDAKEGKDGEKPVADFCSLKTEDKKIVDELFFGIGNFQEASVNHTINVTDIIYPSNVDKLKPAEVRELAKRKGVITRTSLVDSVDKKSTAEFVA
jgi:hypothetical protein